MIGVFERMANELPPPHELPEADKAPDQLTAFLYLMMRDLIPPGYVAGILREACMSSNKGRFTNQHLGDYAAEVARMLSYVEPPVAP